MTELRLYFFIRAQTAAAPTENQWRAVLTDAAQQSSTFIRAIVQYANRHGGAAQNVISANKRSQNPAQLRRYTLCGVEINSDDKDEALALLDTIAATRSIIGTAKQKFEGVMQAELREAAIRQGFSGAQANKISVTVITLAERDTAMADVQAYVAANAAIWYDPAQA